MKEGSRDLLRDERRIAIVQMWVWAKEFRFEVGSRTSDWHTALPTLMTLMTLDKFTQSVPARVRENVRLLNSRRGQSS